MKFSPEALQILSKGYLQFGETPEHMYERLASTATILLNLDEDFQADLEYILKQQFLGPSTPVCTNFGTDRGLPISCYVNQPQDSLVSIFESLTEASVMSKLGGGVGVDLSKLRAEGEKFADNGRSSGGLAWAKIYDTAINSVAQGNTRRGSFSYYFDIDSSDFDAFIQAKDHTSGDHRRHLDGNIAVLIRDGFMNKLKAGDVEARRRFDMVLKSRLENGSPYIQFIDNMSRDMPLHLQEAGRKYSGSNICTEVASHADADHSFVCCLSSLNLDKFDEWKNWVGRTGLSVVELSVYFLDAVMQEFINESALIPHLQKARRLAIACRPLGLGVMGYHSYLQKKGYSWKQAETLNKEIFLQVRHQSNKATMMLGRLYGASKWSGGRRNSVTLAIAPTMTNSVLSGANSQGVEPISANILVNTGAKGVFERKNKNLENLLEFYSKNTLEVWQSILENKGSVGHLDFLTVHEKEVFLTAFEIDQLDIIKQAADRQVYLDQTQSINLFFSDDVDAETFYRVHIEAYKQGLHTLYYVRSTSATERMSKQKIATIYTKDGCPWCEKAKVVLKKQNYGIIELKQKHPDWPTYPAIIIDNKLIGGYDELVGETTAECVACEG